MEHILEWINSDVIWMFKSSQGPSSSGNVLSYLSGYIHIYIYHFPLCVSMHLYTVNTQRTNQEVYPP